MRIQRICHAHLRIFEFIVFANLLHERTLYHPLIWFSQFKMFRICILLNYMWLIINVKRQWCWKFLKRFIIFIFPKLLYMQILMSLLWQIMFSFFITQKSFQLLVNLSLENKILWFFSSWLFFCRKKKWFQKLLLSHSSTFFKYSAPSSFSDLTQMKIF